MSLRVAAGQAASVPGDVPANVAAALALVAAAADRGARVVVLPELFLTGYAPESWTHEDSIALDDPALEPLSELVSERDFFTAGDHGASLVVDGCELGLGICYDSSFPEHAVAAARDGASAYLCPAGSFAGSEHRHDLKFAARAMDAGLYVVVAGLTGSCGASVFVGRSAVLDPDGRSVAGLGDEEGVVVHDLDRQTVGDYRAEHPTEAERLRSLGVRERLVVPPG